MPRHMLATDEIPSIIRPYFADNSGWVERSVAYGPPHLELTVPYFWNSTRQAVVMVNPLAVSGVQGDDALEPVCSETLAAIQE